MTADRVAGLCAVCRHARRVESARGSTFILCARSKDDPRFTKYPALPVLRCAGYEERSHRDINSQGKGAHHR